VEPTLIVPLIGSVESVHARQFARAAARLSGGRIVLLRAVPHRHPHVSRADEAHVRGELEDLAHELRNDGISVEAQVRRAEPRAAIIDAVRELDASVIVRSSFKGHDLAGWLRGTIVDEVMHQIQIPVLIVPAGDAETPAPGSRLRVLAPLDGSAPAESSLVHILGIAGHRPLEIRLVEVVQRRLGPLGALLPFLPDSEAERRETTRYLHDLAAALRAEGVVALTDVIESHDSVGRVVLDIARRAVVDVVALATRGTNSRGDLPRDEVAAEVLEHSPLPVLLVPIPTGTGSIGNARPGDRPDIREPVRP
jgi:nucleotide-binding universal stress UspA family protein